MPASPTAGGFLVFNDRLGQIPKLTHLSAPGPNIFRGPFLVSGDVMLFRWTGTFAIGSPGLYTSAGAFGVAQSDIATLSSGDYLDVPIVSGGTGNATPPSLATAYTENFRLLGGTAGGAVFGDNGSGEWTIIDNFGGVSDCFLNPTLYPVGDSLNNFNNVPNGPERILLCQIFRIHYIASSLVIDGLAPLGYACSLAVYEDFNNVDGFFFGSLTSLDDAYQKFRDFDNQIF